MHVYITWVSVAILKAFLTSGAKLQEGSERDMGISRIITYNIIINYTRNIILCDSCIIFFKYYM